MAEDILQLISPGDRRRNGEAWAAVSKSVNDQLRRARAAAKTDTEADKNQDRLIPQVFPAKITGSTAQTALSGTRFWWTYQWEEVERDASGGTWTVLTNGRTQTLCGDAWNVYETTIDNAGGNTISITPVRIAVTTNSVVTMNVDPNGRPWFDRINPVEVC